MQGIEVEQIDHVHVHVSDRDVSAEWYGDVLGLRRDLRFATWADDPDGPLMLVTSAGDTRIALFRARGDRSSVSGDHTIAFRTSGKGFVAFVGRLADLHVSTEGGRPLASNDVVDHGLAWSLYFRDPDGNRIELTTYDRELVARALAR